MIALEYNGILATLEALNNAMLIYIFPLFDQLCIMNQPAIHKDLIYDKFVPLSNARNEISVRQSNVLSKEAKRIFP